MKDLNFRRVNALEQGKHGHEALNLRKEAVLRLAYALRQIGGDLGGGQLAQGTAHLAVCVRGDLPDGGIDVGSEDL